MVGASGKREGPHQRHARQPPLDAEAGVHRLHARTVEQHAANFLSGVHSKQAVRTAAMPSKHLEFVIRRHARAKAHIFLMHYARKKCALNGRVDCRVLGYEQHASSIAIEAVREVEFAGRAVAPGQ